MAISAERRLTPRVFVAALFLLAAALAIIPPGAALLAHGELERSQPAAGAVLAEPPGRVTLWFSQELASTSEVKVFGPAGQRVDDGSTRVSVTEPDSMSVGLLPLSPGVYRVDWQSVSLVDGDRAEGSFTFSVGPEAAGSDGGSTWAIAALVVAFLALAAVLAGRRRIRGTGGQRQ